jgi:hypothetical protein
LIAAFIITVLSLLAAHGLTVWAYQKITEGLRQENVDLRDRWNVSKGLPPSGVDMKERYEKREEQREQAKKISLPRGDELQTARFKLIHEEQQSLGRTG